MITGKPYPVRAMITLSSNPMVTQPNVKLVYKAIKSLDLYVVDDYWLTPSAELADYVFPAASWLERPTIWNGYDSGDFVSGCEAAMPAQVEGQYDRKTDYEFWRGLGIRLGQEEYWPWQTLEEAFDHRFEPMGLTFKQFVREVRYTRATREDQKYEKTGFGTSTKKAELYSTVLEELGYDPLPRYYEAFDSPIGNPELAKEYPLILITGKRHQPYYHSEHRQIDSLRKQHPYPLVEIHPETASRLGIADSDWVWIETPRGRVKQRCEYTDGIDPRVVSAEHGWWFPELPGEEPWLHGVWESNINVVTDDEPDHCNPINGGWPLRTLLCKVYRAKTY
jgi:anaerobic selenocysteine-containing dehydrogenase